MATHGDFKARFAAAFDNAINEAEYTASMDGLDPSIDAVYSCLIYTSPSQRD